MKSENGTSLIVSALTILVSWIVIAIAMVGMREFIGATFALIGFCMIVLACVVLTYFSLRKDYKKKMRQ
jgi:uncharacterized membrane protein YkvI